MRLQGTVVHAVAGHCGTCGCRALWYMRLQGTGDCSSWYMDYLRCIDGCGAHTAGQLEPFLPLVRYYGTMVKYYGTVVTNGMPHCFTTAQWPRSSSPLTTVTSFLPYYFTTAQRPRFSSTHYRERADQGGSLRAGRSRRERAAADAHSVGPCLAALRASRRYKPPSAGISSERARFSLFFGIMVTKFLKSRVLFK